MPVKVGVPVSQKFAVHFIRAKGRKDSLRYKGHLFQKCKLTLWTQMEQLRLMPLAQEQRVSLEMLMIPYDHITSLKLFDKIRVFPSLNHRNPVANETHCKALLFA